LAESLHAAVLGLMQPVLLQLLLQLMVVLEGDMRAVQLHHLTHVHPCADRQASCELSMMLKQG